MSEKIEKNRLLIVEGTHEKGFFSAALKHLQMPEVQVMPIGGKTQLRQNLQALVLDPRFGEVQALGIARDADATSDGALSAAAISAFDSVCGSLTHAGLPVPATHGAVIKSTVRIGTFIFPNGLDDGSLETICVASIQDMPEFGCVDAYVACLMSNSIDLTAPDKTRVRTWLASRRDPDFTVGTAAAAGEWDFNAPAFAPIFRFLRELYSEA